MDVHTSIRPPAEDGFGSSLRIERMTGYVPADLASDKIKRAPVEERPKLALSFATLAGEGLGRFPIFLSAAQTRAAIDRVASYIEKAQRPAAVEEMIRRCCAAEQARNAAREERVLRGAADSVRLLVSRFGLDALLETQISDYAELAALDCDASPLRITECIAQAAGEQRDAQLKEIRRAAESGARQRMAPLEGAEELFEEHLQRCEEHRLPIFDFYEVDPQTNSPSPAQCADEQAEREHNARRAADERTLGAIEERLRSYPALPETEILANVREAARETRWDSMSRAELEDRLSAACRADAELRDAIQTTIEFVRDDSGRSSDAALEAEIRDHLCRCRAALEIEVDIAESTALAPSLKGPNVSTVQIVNEPVSGATKTRPLRELSRPPGLVGEIVDWIEASAEFPSRELALGAALGWVAAVAGRGFETPSRARTNLYMVTLAPSGHGKDHAPSCINSLAQAAGLDRFLGPARFMSASGLRNELKDQPTMLAIQDEFGGIIRQIDGPRVGIHNELIRYDLLGLFSRAKDHYAGAAYASLRAVKLYNPNLCLLGLSTPDDFWSALSSSRAADGFLARFLLFNVDGSKPGRTKPSASAGKPPQWLIEGTQAIYKAVYDRGNMLGSRDATAPFPSQEVPLDDGAKTILEALEGKIGQALATADVKAIPFLNRVYEHALKLALTVAIGAKPAAPHIDAEIMSWAADLAWVSTTSLAREAENRIADNERQRSFNRVLEIVRRAGAAGIPKGKIVDKLSGTLDKRTRTELIEEAVESGRIVDILFKPQTGRPGWRYVAIEFRPAAA